MNLVGTWLTDRMDLQLHVYQLKILIRIVKVRLPAFHILGGFQAKANSSLIANPLTIPAEREQYKSSAFINWQTEICTVCLLPYCQLQVTFVFCSTHAHCNSATHTHHTLPSYNTINMSLISQSNIRFSILGPSCNEFTMLTTDSLSYHEYQYIFKVSEGKDSPKRKFDKCYHSWMWYSLWWKVRW